MLLKKEYYTPRGLKAIETFDWITLHQAMFDMYNDLVSRGVRKEQARAILPVGVYTKFYWTVNGSSLMNFLKLRLNKDAQAEIREYAEAILNMVKVIAPMSFREFVPLLLEY